VAAAWRQAGASAKFGREQRMMLPALCHTSLHPRLRQTARYGQVFY